MKCGGVFGITVIIIGNEICDPSSNPRQDYISLYNHAIGRDIESIFSPSPAKSKE